LAKNPNGRIPTLQLDDGSYLFESNAIVWYLAEGTKLAPADRRARRETLQWMFFEQYSHEPFIATVRFWKHFLPKAQPAAGDGAAGAHGEGLRRPGRHGAASGASPVLRRQPVRSRDIALYTYTHVAGEGGFNLDNYPQVNAWMAKHRRTAGLCVD